ncbi:HNT1 [Enterospora canceri]|uniref:HNT1 n=1 Tax=Enterospora canceri TaxID=1081671 RepID=A0A1Y1S6Z5_9MICR|nr:HNT1 [Enterospora canceri]
MSEIQSNTCLFCKLKEIKHNILVENESVYVIADRYPCSRCHLLVISKKHTKLLHETDDTTLTDAVLMLKQLALRLGLRSYNILNNNTFNQLIPHAHIHLVEASEKANFTTVPDSNLSEVEYQKKVEDLKKRLAESKAEGG